MNSRNVKTSRFENNNENRKSTPRMLQTMLAKAKLKKLRAARETIPANIAIGATTNIARFIGNIMSPNLPYLALKIMFLNLNKILIKFAPLVVFCFILSEFVLGAYS
jgi:hypothetical protein